MNEEEKDVDCAGGAPEVSNRAVGGSRVAGSTPYILKGTHFRWRSAPMEAPRGRQTEAVSIPFST